MYVHRHYVQFARLIHPCMHLQWLTAHSPMLLELLSYSVLAFSTLCLLRACLCQGRQGKKKPLTYGQSNRTRDRAHFL